jgi:hypothetical protein
MKQLYLYTFDIITLCYISLPSWPNINTLCSMADCERFSVRVDHRVQILATYAIVHVPTCSASVLPSAGKLWNWSNYICIHPSCIAHKTILSNTITHFKQELNRITAEKTFGTLCKLWYSSISTRVNFAVHLLAIPLRNGRPPVQISAHNPDVFIKSFHLFLSHGNVNRMPQIRLW